jgi:hypothetical protein
MYIRIRLCVHVNWVIHIIEFYYSEAIFRGVRQLKRSSNAMHDDWSFCLFACGVFGF